MGDDRPFQCTEPGCGMRFTNEDHLGVHKAKHEMSLALTSGNTRAGSIITFVADQTPTPTKFLRNCEEIGLFHELSKNPFEEAFKKAFAEGKVHDLHESSPFPGPLCDSEAVLNTPNPGLLLSVLDDDSHRREKLISVKSLMTSVASSENYIPLPGPTVESGSTLIGEIHAASSESSRVSVLSPGNPMRSAGTSVIDSKRLRRWKSTSNPGLSSQVESPMSEDDVDDLDSDLDHDSSQDSLVIGESAASVLQQSSSVVGSVLTPGTSLLPVTTDPGGGICFLQVMIKSPTGEVVPVQIPAALSTSVAVVTTVGNAAVGTPTGSSGGSAKPLKSFPSSSSTSTSLSNSTSMGIANSTKQRLKAAIKQNVQQSVLQNNMQVMSDAVDLVTTQLQLQQQDSSKATRPTSLAAAGALDSPSHLVKLPPQVELQDADTSTPKKPRLSTDDDPDERRKKFLERNRAAAARCRMKKKVWVTNLEQKADDLQSANNRLQNEVVQLRSEVLQLRTMLATHKDCPVTLRQRALSQGAIQVEMQSDDVTSSSPIVVTPNAEEIAMAALSTMASRGHISRGAPVILTVSDFLPEQQ